MRHRNGLIVTVHNGLTTSRATVWTPLVPIREYICDVRFLPAAVHGSQRSGTMTCVRSHGWVSLRRGEPADGPPCRRRTRGRPRRGKCREGEGRAPHSASRAEHQSHFVTAPWNHACCRDIGGHQRPRRGHRRSQAASRRPSASSPAPIGHWSSRRARRSGATGYKGVGAAHRSPERDGGWTDLGDCFDFIRLRQGHCVTTADRPGPSYSFLPRAR